jgi:hypothetical protein
METIDIDELHRPVEESVLRVFWTLIREVQMGRKKLQSKNFIDNGRVQDQMDFMSKEKEILNAKIQKL